MNFFIAYLFSLLFLLGICLAIAVLIGLPVLLTFLFGEVGKWIGITISGCAIAAVFMAMDLVE